MNSLDLTICVEGSTDVMLAPIIRWALGKRLGQGVAINDRCVHRSGTLAYKIESAVRESGNCDLLVIHRDADTRDGHARRAAEIDAAVAAVVARGVSLPPRIRVIPVREAEAWLLFDEAAIRLALQR